jgi:nickel/cobalt exporter
MKLIHLFPSLLITAAAIILINFAIASAHPLGNFTINHFTRIEVAADHIGLHYVIDMAEIPTFQELQAIGLDLGGEPSLEKLNAYAERVARSYADGLLLAIDGEITPLKVVARNITLPPGAGGLPTLRLECDFVALLPPVSLSATHRLLFEDKNMADRIGWREITVAPASGIAVFNSSALAGSITNELRAYPAELLNAPLDERVAELSFSTGVIPAGATPLLTRDGRHSKLSRDKLTELIAVPQLTPPIAILGLLIAGLLGGLHALSPGHGKAIVGAYLIGSRGTARHAALLGLTVTVTHTAGVFALGAITLFASHYVFPERLFPIISLISGTIVLTLGLSLFVRRARSQSVLQQEHHHRHQHVYLFHTHYEHDHHDHSHQHTHHSHSLPGASADRVSWRSLLALGVSGGLLPCPSALVVLLSAISLDRIGYGLLLVTAFSLGLASVLTGVGLVFIYARQLLAYPALSSYGRIAQALPALSALVIACVGAAICCQALAQAGLNLANITQWLSLVAHHVFS